MVMVYSVPVQEVKLHSLSEVLYFFYHIPPPSIKEVIFVGCNLQSTPVFFGVLSLSSDPSCAPFLGVTGTPFFGVAGTPFFGVVGTPFFGDTGTPFFGVAGTPFSGVLSTPSLSGVF